jgi:hypothetical protein
LHVRKSDAVQVVTQPVGPKFLGEAPGGALYRWPEASEAALAGVLLPSGYVLTAPKDSPRPVAARVVGKRLAVFWIPDGLPLDWLMKPGEVGPRAESINRDSQTSGTIPPAAGMVMHEPRSSLVDVRMATLAFGGALDRGQPTTSSVPRFRGRGELPATLHGPGDVRGIKLLPEISIEASVDHRTTSFGTYHALLIGVKDYRNNSRSDLETPIEDITRLRDVLVGHMASEDRHVRLLRDAEATRQGILNALISYRRLGSSDNLLVYYAGHGFQESTTRMDSGSRMTLRMRSPPGSPTSTSDATSETSRQNTRCSSRTAALPGRS